MDNNANYTFNAFIEPVHLLLLTAVLIAAVTINVNVLAAVAVLEVLYLALVPRMVPYKRRVDLKQQLTKLEVRRSERDLRASKLSRDVRRRFKNLCEQAEALDARADALGLDRKTLDELLEAGLSLSLSLEAYNQEERKAPLAELAKQKDEAPEDTALLAKYQARQQGEKMRVDVHNQLTALETALQRLANQQTEETLQEGQASTAQRDIQAALKTAREMSAFDIAGRQ